MWRHGLLPGIVAWLAVSNFCTAPAAAVSAYISNEKSNTVSVIDTDSWTVTATIKVGQRPRGIEYTRDGKFVLVAVGDDDTIQVIDATTRQVVDTLPSGPDPELFVQDAAGKRFMSPTRTTTRSRSSISRNGCASVTFRLASSRKAWRSARMARS